MTETLRAVCGSTALRVASTELRELGRVPAHLDVCVGVGAPRARREIAGPA